MTTHKKRKKLLLDMADQQIARILEHGNKKTMQALPPAGTVDLSTKKKRHPPPRAVLATT